MKSLLSTSMALAVLLTMTACSTETAETPKAKDTGKPNILLIMADDMGFSDIGPFGSEVATPNLDSLAADGMRFNQFRNTSKCTTTRATLMTGQYAQRVGMGTGTLNYLRHVTFGDVLQSAGYKTLMVGKHHATDNPYDMGFDHYWGMRDGAANHFNPGVQRPGEPDPAHKPGAERVFCFDAKCVKPYTPPNKDYYSTDTFTDWALTLLDRHEQENDEQPFLMYLSYTAPHYPIQAWPKDIAKYEGKYDEGYEAIAKARYERQIASGLISAETHPRSEPMHKPWDELSDEKKQQQSEVMAIYGAMIDNLDQNIGRVLTRLEETGEKDNTLVIFLSDNGASAEELDIGDGAQGTVNRYNTIDGQWANVSDVPFKAYKNSSFEGGVLSPFIANWPGVIKAGGPVNETSSHLVDIMATFVDITGATYPTEARGHEVGSMDGVSLLPAFENGTVERDKPVFLQWRNGKAIVDGHWKLVHQKLTQRDKDSGLWRFATEEWELYDLSKDRTETNNIATSNPEKFNELKAKYDAWWAEMEPIVKRDKNR